MFVPSPLAGRCVCVEMSQTLTETSSEVQKQASATAATSDGQTKIEAAPTSEHPELSSSSSKGDPPSSESGENKRPAAVLESTNSDTSSSSSAAAKKPKVDPKSLPTRQYLDQTVVPILLDALAALAKERPQEPIDFLTEYLQKHKEDHKC